MKTIQQLIKSVAVAYEAKYRALDAKREFEMFSDDYNTYNKEQAMYEELLEEALQALADMGIDVDL
jgi:hypothetical protein